MELKIILLITMYGMCLNTGVFPRLNQPVKLMKLHKYVLDALEVQVH